MLRKLKTRLGRVRPHMEQPLLELDDARQHTSARSTAEIRRLGSSVSDHPSYRPDLAPPGFLLFPKLEERLRGRHYRRRSDDEVRAAVVPSSKCTFLSWMAYEITWTLAEVCRPPKWLWENEVYSNIFTHYRLRITRRYLSAHLRTPSVYFIVQPWFHSLLTLQVRRGTCHPVARDISDRKTGRYWREAHEQLCSVCHTSVQCLWCYDASKRVF